MSAWLLNDTRNVSIQGLIKPHQPQKYQNFRCGSLCLDVYLFLYICIYRCMFIYEYLSVYLYTYMYILICMCYVDLAFHFNKPGFHAIYYVLFYVLEGKPFFWNNSLYQKETILTELFLLISSNYNIQKQKEILKKSFE